MTRLDECIAVAMEVYQGLDSRPEPLKTLSWAHEPYYVFLYEYAKRLRPTYMVEIGTRHGTSAIHLAAGNPDGSVVTVDIDPGEISIAKRNATERIVSNIEFVEGDSATVVVPDGYDLLFIDGMHTYAAMSSDYKRFRDGLLVGGIMLFDDTCYSPEMERAWDEIVESKTELLGMHYTGFGAAMK